MNNKLLELKEKVKNGYFDDNELIDLVLYLERENQELKKELEIIIKCSDNTNDLANKYKEVIDKAREWINNHIDTFEERNITIYDWNSLSNPKELLDILKEVE